MCGRYALHSLIDDLQRHFGFPGGADFKPRYNIAPSYHLPVVRKGDGGRELALCQWGFVPHWMKSEPKTRPINARAETVAEKPFFRSAFRHHRCLVPANGYYEWKKEGRGKQPWFIHPKDQALFAFAGLWDRWTGADGVLDTFTIITTSANPSTASIHDRMPVILPPGQYDTWLEAGGKDLLRPYAGEMEAWPVSREVNTPANDHPHLLDRQSG